MQRQPLQTTLEKAKNEKIKSFSNLPGRICQCTVNTGVDTGIILNGKPQNLLEDNLKMKKIYMEYKVSIHANLNLPSQTVRWRIWLI